jgi:hypothetical protein
MGKQAVAESDAVLRRIDQVRQDCRKREVGPEWVVDTCERAAKEGREASQLLLENALRNKNANNKVIAATLYQSHK